MNRPKPDCVIDSSVILDFYQVKSLSSLMGFPYRLITLDLMVHDLETPGLSEIKRAGIVAVATDVKIMLSMAECAEKHKISIYDASLLLHSKESGAILLSGDKALRAAAKNEEVVVKGTLWVLEELVKSAVLQPAPAVFILERMFMLGRRLPPGESSSRIFHWEEQQK